MKVLLGGGTGFIGRHLKEALISRGHIVTVISRTPGYQRITWDRLEQQNELPDFDAVVNLSGENILNFLRRWNQSYRDDLFNSRIGKNKLLVELMRKAVNKPKVWVSGHAVGYYPVDGVQEFDETYILKKPTTFIETLCKQWEESARVPQSENIRHVAVRIGIVLGSDGGMIQKSYWPFYFGLGGNIGSGKQYFHWIHIKDITNLFVYALENDNVTQVLNGVAPGACTNEEFTKTFGNALNRPTWFPVPEFFMKYVTGSDRADMILKGNKVIPSKTLESGFKFEFTNISDAMRDILK